MSVAVRELTTAQEVFANRKRVRDAFSKLVPNQNRILELSNELESVKAERDQYRASLEKVRSENIRLHCDLQNVAKSMTADEASKITRGRGPKVEKIQQVVCEHYGVKVVDVLSRRRTKHLIQPRHVGMYLCKKLTLKSLPVIGRKFGGRDHTTVLHAVDKIDGLLTDGNQELARDIREITERVFTA